MKTKAESQKKKLRNTIRLFREAIAYRRPISVTRVLVLHNNTSYPICPKCLVSLEREYMSFCDRCGQKLNWDLYEDAEICHPGFKRRLFWKTCHFLDETKHM